MLHSPDPYYINERQLFGQWQVPIYPIEFALLECDPALLKKYLDAGANPNVDIGGGWTLLHKVCANAIDSMIQNHRNEFYPELLEIIKLLVENGGDLHKKNDKGKKPLDVICAYSSDNKENFDSLVSLFKSAISNVDELVTYQGCSK
jgi:ankyrin repeat protein